MTVIFAASAAEMAFSLELKSTKAVAGETIKASFKATGFEGYVDSETKSGIAAVSYDLVYDIGFAPVVVSEKDEIRNVGTKGADFPTDWSFGFSHPVSTQVSPVLLFTFSSSSDIKDGTWADFDVKIADNVKVGDKLNMYLVRTGGILAGQSSQLDDRAISSVTIGDKVYNNVVQTVTLEIVAGDVPVSSNDPVGDTQSGDTPSSDVSDDALNTSGNVTDKVVYTPDVVVEMIEALPSADASSERETSQEVKQQILQAREALKNMTPEMQQLVPEEYVEKLEMLEKQNGLVDAGGKDTALTPSENDNKEFNVDTIPAWAWLIISVLSAAALGAIILIVSKRKAAE